MARFLLISLSIDAILSEATIRKRRERLDLMTSGLGLEGAYDATLDRIRCHGKGKSTLGMAALMWISFSERPMHIGELCDGLGVEIGSRDMDYENIPSERTLLAACVGLVTVDESSIVRLVHFTLQEYFNGHSEHFESPHSAMAEVCLTYLNFDSVDEISYTLDSAPPETRFLKYASSYWGLYARKGLTEGVRLLALQLLGKFGGHISAKLLLWGNFDRWEPMRRYSKGFTGLHCAAYLGLEEIAIGLLEEDKGCSADMADGWGRTPLIWAAESGHEGMVKLLFKQKGVNPNSKDHDGSTPLWHERIVKLLHGRTKVNPNSRDTFGDTSLTCAARGGHEGVVKLLLDRKKVNPDSRNNDGQTPLWYALVGEYEGIVKLLLDRKQVNPNSRGYYGQTPLWHAVKGGHEGIVKLLLSRKEVDLDPRDNFGHTPLQWAARCGYEGIVKLLLDWKEVNPAPRDDSYRTALLQATRLGKEVVRMLLRDYLDAESDM